MPVKACTYASGRIRAPARPVEHDVGDSAALPRGLGLEVLPVEGPGGQLPGVVWRRGTQGGECLGALVARTRRAHARGQVVTQLGRELERLAPVVWLSRRICPKRRHSGQNSRSWAS